MSRNFASIPLKPFDGAPFALPIANEVTKSPLAIPLIINWGVFGASLTVPNMGVAFNLAGQLGTARGAIEKISSLYIDNINCDTPIYVVFPDTGYQVVCPPNSTHWEAVITNALNFKVFGIGFSNASALTAPQTTVYVMNVKVNPFTTTELPQVFPRFLASSIITRGTTIYNENYAIPAVGDQTAYAELPLSGATLTDELLPAAASGFYYITNIYWQVVNTSVGGSAGTCAMFIESLSGLDVLYKATAYGDNIERKTQTLLQLHGQQTKLDATKGIQMRRSGALTTGTAYAMICYAKNPI